MSEIRERAEVKDSSESRSPDPLTVMVQAYCAGPSATPQGTMRHVLRALEEVGFRIVHSNDTAALTDEMVVCAAGQLTAYRGNSYMIAMAIQAAIRAAKRHAP